MNLKRRLIFENSTLRDNTGKAGELNDIYNDNGTVEFGGSGTNSIESGIAGSGDIIKTGSGIFNIGGDNKNYTGNFSLNGGTVHLLANSSYFSAQNTFFENNTNFDMQNNEINNINFENLHLNGRTNIQADLDFNTRTMDRINASGVSGSGSLFVNNLAMTGAPEGESFSIPFTLIPDSSKHSLSAPCCIVSSSCRCPPGQHHFPGNKSSSSGLLRSKNCPFLFSTRTSAQRPSRSSPSRINASYNILLSMDIFISSINFRYVFST